MEEKQRRLVGAGGSQFGIAYHRSGSLTERHISASYQREKYRMDGFARTGGNHQKYRPSKFRIYRQSVHRFHAPKRHLRTFGRIQADEQARAEHDERERRPDKANQQQTDGYRFNDRVGAKVLRKPFPMDGRRFDTAAYRLRTGNRS